MRGGSIIVDPKLIENRAKRSGRFRKPAAAREGLRGGAYLETSTHRHNTILLK
jgi:hypothetical protein